MVIISDKIGQLGNRLFEFSFLIANAIDNNYSVINPNFEEYAHFFCGTKKLCSKIVDTKTRLIITSNIPFKKNAFQHIVNWGVNALNKRNCTQSKYHLIFNIMNEAGLGGGGESYDLNSAEFTSDAKEKIVFLKGAWYSDANNFIKNAKIIRSVFKPISEYQILIDKNIKRARIGKDILIGVHIRRGDYKEFLGGKYYFEDSYYKLQMIDIESQFKKKYKKVSFLIVSNEKFNTTNFDNLNIIYIENHFIIDLYSLAACDYIMGPVSTFSRWASFYGQVPLFEMEKERKIAINDFKIVAC